MDTQGRKSARRGLVGTETPEAGLRPSNSRTEQLTRSFLKSTSSPLRFATKQEMEMRENDEVCSKHGNPIVAFEEQSGETLCEKCVYTGKVDRPVFTAVVAKQIKNRFDAEYSTFEKLCDELMSINQSEVKSRIQTSVTDFFDALRAKCDDLEEKTVAKIENSKNLNELYDVLKQTHDHMEENCVAERYDQERTRLDIKVSEVRYTYVCQRKQHYDETINAIESDNKMLAEAVENARKMIVSIFDCNKDIVKIQNTLNDLVSGLMTIDEKHPDFEDLRGSERRHPRPSQKMEEEKEEVKQEIAFSTSEHKEGNWKSEEMKEIYFNKENALCKKEFVGDKFEETEIMALKVHLQKVLTVPTARGSRVFLFGGSKDSEGKQALHKCFEVNTKKKSMSAVDNLATPKLSFAAAISPDTQKIYIAGGSTGENKSTNECEVFTVSKKKWSQMPALNQPRFSGSLVVCENTDLYCFGGVDNDPKDPTKFATLRSIETLNLTTKDAEWQTLSLTLPFKTSSPGAISLGYRAFVVFGGWNKKTLNSAVIVREAEESEYVTEECGSMVKEDTFVSNGLVSRNAETRECIVFGTSHVHAFNENTKSFTLIE